MRFFETVVSLVQNGGRGTVVAGEAVVVTAQLGAKFLEASDHIDVNLSPPMPELEVVRHFGEDFSGRFR